MKKIIWAYGGGTQSIAIALLVAQGKVPRPDRIIFADTGREATETWEYTERYVKPLLASVELTIEVASHTLATVDLYGGKEGKTLLIPAYAAFGGKLSNFCSHEWKMYVIRRHVGGAKAYPNGCINWLGISTDEVERLHPSDVAWMETHWPLCGMPTQRGYVQMSRAACKQLIRDFGWPEPPKSSCWMCPHRRNSQWHRLKMLYPQDFEKAVQLDREIRANDTRGGVYLHASRKPLDEIDFQAEESQQPELLGCDSGHCFV